ncbi:hypothetical protein NKH18_01575 [Streptomyces sp. M10(2022)]
MLAAEVGASAPPARPAILHPGPRVPSTTIAARPSGGATHRETL